MNIFITGGTRGIGKALASLHRERGDQVGICGVKHRDLGNFYQANINDKDSIEEAVAKFEAQHGPIDVFYANAGVGVSDKSKEPKIDRDIALTQTNVLGFLNSVAAIVPKFIERKHGHLVSISSIAALVGLPGNAAYCASKAYVSRYSQSLARDLKKLGVFVTCIQPSYIDTDLTRDNNHPMPFLITPDKAAEKIFAAVQKRKETYSFVFPTSFVTYLLSIFPQVLQSKILSFIKYK